MSNDGNFGQPGSPYAAPQSPAQPTGPKPPNYLVASIISIFCCWPLAIPAIIFATQVDSKWAMGDYAGAKDASGKAKTFMIIGFTIGILSNLAVLGFYLVAFAAAVSQQQGAF